MRRRFLRPAMAPVLLCAFYVFLVFFTAAPALYDESEAYFQYGRNLLSTGTYGVVAGVPDDLREPGYGIFLAAAIAPALAFTDDTGALLRWIVLVQAALFAASVFAFFRLSQLPLALRWTALAVFLFSPTLLGAHSVIYSESIVVTLMLVVLTALAGPAFPRPRSLAVVGVCAGYILLTKMYLLFFVPLAMLGFLAAAVRLRGSLRREAAMRFLVLMTLASLPFLLWSARGRGVEKRHENNDRVIIQLAGKVYRHTQWKLGEEWKPALLASCCLSTCVAKYGLEVCRRYTWMESDGLGYTVLESWKNRPPEEKKKSVLRETLEYWWSTLPVQVVSSGLELLRIAFLEGAQVHPDSHPLWKRFAQLWHFFGSIGVWILALAGLAAARREGKSDAFIRRASIGGIALIAYHLLFMSQVTNVQRYSVPILPWLYWFVSLALWRAFVALRARRISRPESRKAQSK